MAVTHNDYVGNNSTTNYSFTFPYLKSTDVQVQVDAAVTTAWTFANATTVQFNTAPATGAKIKILRETNVDSLAATFYAGSAIKSEDLNDNYTQNLYKTQEVGARYFSNTGGTMTGDLTLDAGADLIFEGTTSDAHETKLGVTDPTADQTYNLPNNSAGTYGILTTGDVGTVNTGMIAADAITNAKIADNAINSEHYADGSIATDHIADLQVTTGKIASDAITGAKIADDAINSEHYANGSIATDHIADSQVTTGKINDLGVTTAKIAANAVTGAKIAGTTIEAGQLNSNAVITSKITDLNVTTGKIADSNITLAKLATDLKSTTVTDDDTKLPTSGAVVDYVAAQIAPIGGLEVIATDAAFPNTQPSSGVVISIADAGGLVVSTVDGVVRSTTGRTVGGSTVTINNIASNFNNTTVDAGVAMMVSSTGSGQIYNYHKATLKEADLLSLSGDINDFGARYRVTNAAPTTGLCAANGTGSGSFPCDGDMYWNTSTSKMYVFDAPAASTSTTDLQSAWGEVTSTGDFKYLFLCPAGGTGAPTLNGSIATYDLRDGSNSGVAATVTNAAQLTVSINGVIQKANTGTSAPSEGFALADTNTIVFGSNLASGDSVFIIQAGSAVSIPTPGDNSVTTDKIADNAVTLAKMAGIARGKIIYGDANGDPAVLNAGSSGQVLQADSNGDPTWQNNSAGAVGGNSNLNRIFWENEQAVTHDYTITNNHNAGSFGPITINSGITITIGAGESWTVI